MLKFPKRWALAGLVALLFIPATAIHAAASETNTVSDRLGRGISDAGLAPIKLRCVGHGGHAPTVGCTWRIGEDVRIATLQLWKVQVYPFHGSRTLVAELGADARGHRDTDVVSPAGYLYAVLGLDDDGDIVARSRLAPVRLSNHEVGHLRLSCDGVLRTPAILCEWTDNGDSAFASYVLYRDAGGNGREVVARLGADSASYLDTSVECGVRYRYWLAGLDREGRIAAVSRVDHASCRDQGRVRDIAKRADRLDLAEVSVLFDSAPEPPALPTDRIDVLRGRGR